MSAYIGNHSVIFSDPYGKVCKIYIFIVVSVPQYHQNIFSKTKISKDIPGKNIQQNI